MKLALSENGFDKRNTFLHCDGALAGLLLPLADASFPEDGIDEETSRRFQVSFEKGIDTISVSGHKMLGCPMPCGVVITRKEHMKRFSKTVEYLNSTGACVKSNASN